MNIPRVDPQTVWYTARQLSGLVEAPWMLLTDASGTLLANPADSTLHGQDLSRHPGVNQALEGDEFVGTWNYAGDLLRIVVVPVDLGEQILGTLVIGERLDDAHAQAIREFTGRDAMILSSGELVAWSTEDSATTRATREEVALLQREISADTRMDGPITCELGGQRSLVAISSLSGGGDHIVLFQSLSELESGITAVRNSVLMSGALAIVLAILLSIWVSFRISRPIHQLREAAELLGSGQLPEPVLITSQDDLGHLTSTFNTMAERLQAAHKELETLNRDLELRVRERTRSLVQEVEDHRRTEVERQKAEKELEVQRTLSLRSDRLRSLGEMAASIAHELNQPLVSVRGLAEHTLVGMERGWELSESKLNDRLLRIVEQVERMTHIIEHVRMFAREAGKPEVTDVSVNEVVQSSVDMIGTQFRTCGVDLRTDLAEELPVISANAYSLEEVVFNLLSNARDALEVVPDTDTGEKSVWVLTEPFQRDGVGGVRVSVSDNGIGIEESNLVRVLDPFFTTKGPDRGTGLGLSICQTIIDGFGGSLKIISAPGEGTEVQIFLPCRSNARSA